MVPHTLKVGVIGPCSVESPIDAFQVEDDTRRLEVGFEDLELVSDVLVLVTGLVY